MATPSPRMTAIVEEAYKIFAVPTPTSTGVCKNCCMDPEIERNFLRRPVRRLSPADVSDWYFAALEDMTHDIAAYFLPRIMELISEGYWPCRVSDEVTFCFLAEGGYPDDWSLDERRLIEAFMIALVDEAVSEETFWDTVGLDCIFCMAAHANMDLQVLFDHLGHADEIRLARAVAFDFDMIGGLDESGDLVNAFWTSASTEHQAAMQAWYRRPALPAVLERAFFAETDPKWQRKLSDAIATMQSWAPLPPATPGPLDPRRSGQ